MGEVTIDLVMRDKTGAYRLVLVEEGPWDQPSEEDVLRRLQTRINDTIDVVLDGLILDRFPEMRGNQVPIALDAFNHPPPAVVELIETFDSLLHGEGEYADALRACPHVKTLSLSFRDHGPLDAPA
jgi:hypothetical protein